MYFRHIVQCLSFLLTIYNSYIRNRMEYDSHVCLNVYFETSGLHIGEV